ncbi:glutamate receptor ionotropic, delta-1-like [Clavelina lepadiformis]|uniref:glutamate receptor ionotropic, delta-1-like n=1 Tax=Clavelina lepadiformis TaxID=159417 RepID=UPI00404299C0
MQYSQDEVWETLNGEPSFHHQSQTRPVALVLFAFEDIVRKFMLQLIPELGTSSNVHYYIIDVGWKDNYFINSLLFREGITVVTFPKKFQRKANFDNKEKYKENLGKLQKTFSALEKVFQRAERAGIQLNAKDSNATCSNIMTKFADKNFWLANAIREELGKTVNGTRNERNRVDRLAQEHPYYASYLFHQTKNTTKALPQICQVAANGQLTCSPLLDEVRFLEHGNSCEGLGQEKVEDSLTHVSVGKNMHDVTNDKYYWLSEYDFKLENKTYRVATVEDEPFVFIRNDSNGHPTFSGFSIDLFHMLSEIFAFKYEVYQVEDKKYGAYKDGKWNGLVGDIVSKKADFAIAAMTITPQREKVVDFTKRYMDYAVGILMKKPKTVTNLFAFLNPFDNTVWYSIIAGLFLVSLLLYVLNRVSPKRQQGPPYRDNSLHGTFWFVYSSLVQQGTDMNLITLSSQIVTGVWWFFILIIVSSYTANLAAHLTVTRMENRISSFRDLATQTDMEYGTARDTSIYDFLRRKGTSSTELTTMWSSLWKIVNGTNSFSNPKDGFQKVKDANYAFLWDVAVIEYLILTDPDCTYSTVPDSIYDKGYGIAVQQGHPIREAMSMGILQLQDSGEINRLKHRWWKSAGKCPTEHNGKRSHTSELTLENFAGVFCVLACGLVIASVIAVVELIQYMKNDKKQAPNHNKLKQNLIATRHVQTVHDPASSRPGVYVEKCVNDDVHIIFQNAHILKRNPGAQVSNLHTTSDNTSYLRKRTMLPGFNEVVF